MPSETLEEEDKWTQGELQQIKLSQYKINYNFKNKLHFFFFFFRLHVHVSQKVLYFYILYTTACTSFVSQEHIFLVPLFHLSILIIIITTNVFQLFSLNKNFIRHFQY